MNDTALRQNSLTPPAVQVPAAAIQAAGRVAIQAPATVTPLMWELLVTDGHVRAARLRRLQPWIIALGVVLLWCGIIIAGLGPSIQPKTSVAMRVQERLAQLQMRASVAFNALSRVPPRPDKPERLPSVTELPEVVQALLTSLNTSNKLPEGNLKFTKVDQDAFWAGNWPTEQISYLKSGDRYLVGAYAHVGPATSQQAVRWVGAVKNIDGKWQYATLGWPGLYVPPGLPGASPQAISLSLDPFMPPLPKPTPSQSQS